MRCFSLSLGISAVHRASNPPWVANAPGLRYDGSCGLFFNQDTAKCSCSRICPRSGKSRKPLERLPYESAVGRQYSVLNIVGGGSRNAYLNQLIANATNKTVRIGETEVTAMGNMLTQLEGLNMLSSSEKRKYMASTFSDRIFVPQDT